MNTTMATNTSNFNSETSVMTAELRNLVCHYNPTIVVAALAISLLGAFTSTQLMYQARGARTLHAVLVWTVLGSLVFGFCATWCLHFIGMLSCEFDVAIGLNAPLTILSALLAMVFTFGALSTELIQTHWRRRRRKMNLATSHSYSAADHCLDTHDQSRQSSEPLLPAPHKLSNGKFRDYVDIGRARPTLDAAFDGERTVTFAVSDTAEQMQDDTPFDGIDGVQATQDSTQFHRLPFAKPNHNGHDHADSDSSSVTSDSHPRPSSSGHYNKPGAFGKNATHNSSTDTASGTLVRSFMAILGGLSLVNVTKGFVWSIALTNMHFMGVKALQIPGGTVVLSPIRVVLCAAISWSVCCVGVILMAAMESNLKQQVLFSVVAATGVAAVHFSGMYACSFLSTEPPSPHGGWPVALPIAIGSVAILTCMASTGLLAHSATTARDRLAEVLYTRRRLWAAIAQKDNAEAAAAARSEFIASASHEIRTPLHQLQGYADLLAQSDLSEEDRRLLLAIQHATKSLSMITTNVLDWSRLEKGEAICRPVAVDIRLSCEGMVQLLPNRENSAEVELFIIVSPEVPASIFIDETYLQRILMNLLSNSFKFTLSGYVMLLVHLDNDILHITVKDTGVGIPRSFLPDLFEPYKQVQARGAERGTGLGMSITKRLLERMQGTIVVESKHNKDQGVGEENSGSKFSLAIPVVAQDHISELPTRPAAEPLRITVLHDGKHRAIEGLASACQSYGIAISHSDVFTTPSSETPTIILADLLFLQEHPVTTRDILSQQKTLVVVLYENRFLLDDVLGPTPAINIVPIRKPLVLHRMVQTIISTRELQATVETNELSPLQGSIHDRAHKSKAHSANIRKRTILLVEDNKINQKLGAKMLKMLNYDVLLAEDGQEAVDIVTEHASNIDAILMDQSMPRKDGITAIKEIREMEAAGLVDGRQTIIAVTAAAGTEAQSQFLAAGTDLFLPKPLSLAKLEQTLCHFFKERTVPP